MSIVTLEGIVEKGQIRLRSDFRLRDKTKVYVVIPDMHVENVAHVFSPRLADPSQAIDFKMEVLEESTNATV
jgi:hypothetical protein